MCAIGPVPPPVVMAAIVGARVLSNARNGAESPAVCVAAAGVRRGAAAACLRPATAWWRRERRGERTAMGAGVFCACWVEEAAAWRGRAAVATAGLTAADHGVLAPWEGPLRSAAEDAPTAARPSTATSAIRRFLILMNMPCPVAKRLLENGRRLAH
jgi:hypothetical protein